MHGVHTSKIKDLITVCHKVTSFENVCDKVFEKNCSIQTLNDHVLPWIWMIYNNHGLVFSHTNLCEKNNSRKFWSNFLHHENVFSLAKVDTLSMYSQLVWAFESP
jgi:hypothetical protein